MTHQIDYTNQESFLMSVLSDPNQKANCEDMKLEGDFLIYIDVIPSCLEGLYASDDHSDYIHVVYYRNKDNFRVMTSFVLDRYLDSVGQRSVCTDNDMAGKQYQKGSDMYELVYPLILMNELK